MRKTSPSRGGKILPSLLMLISLLFLSASPPLARPSCPALFAAGGGTQSFPGALAAESGEEKDRAAGSLAPAVVFPLDGNITSPYAYRIDPFYDPASGEEPTYEFHRGIDISAALCRDILSCADGVVIFCGYDVGYGRYMILEHEGFTSLYAHCSSLLRAEGDRVSAGELIATAGSTGRSTGPHLHFEIRVGGQNVDPLDYVGCVFTGKIY